MRSPPLRADRVHNGSFFPRRLLMLFALPLALLWGCGREPASPEEQLRAVLAAAELEVESRDLAAVMERIDPGYEDHRQRDWRQLRAMLGGYFIRHPSIFVISQVDRLEIVQPDRARVVLFAGLAGSAQEAAGPLRGWRANLLRFELEFKQHEGESWRLFRADWRPARRGDF
ncbi:MAG: hypothetical protein PVI92_01355 [Chromatiales bacterium]|jgi:hypothetical protein